MLKRNFKIICLVLSCILVNLSGRLFAGHFTLPLWLDSLGTVIAAYKLGTIPGAIVGVTMNILYSIKSPISFLYSFTSIAIAIIVGFSAKRKWFNSLLGTMNASVLVTLCSVTVSVSISWFATEGMTNNIWGDSVIHYFEEQGLAELPSAIIGQFYIDFLDKVITMLCLYLNLIIWRNRKKFSKKPLSLLLVFLAFSLFSNHSKLSAENVDLKSYVQTVYSNNNGIPCGEANDVAQTPNGILWIGTYAGLYRYNGTEFKCMTNFNSARSINCLYVDDEGRLWIGTNDNGLSICINDKIVNTLDSTKGIPSNSVRKIVKGADGYYYIGTSVGILVLELNSGLRICNIIKDAGYTISLSADNSGLVSAVNAKGELFILNESEVRYSIKLDSESELYTCCAFDKKGILYAGTSKNNIHRYSVTQEESEFLSRHSSENIHYLKSIFFDKDRIFICADNGIGYFDEDFKFTSVSTGQFNNSIDNMCVDYQGNYWFTSSRQGLLRLSSSAFTNLYKFFSLPPAMVNTVSEWNGAFYIGTDKGLDIIQNNRKTENIISQTIGNTRVRCINKDSKNHLWISTYGKGLIEVEENNKITVYDGKNGAIGKWIRVSIELQDGSIAVAGDQGISFIKDKKIYNIIRYGDGLTNAKILSLMELPDGTILAGTDGDGLALIKNQKVIKIFTQNDGLTSNVILRTVYDPKYKVSYIVTSNSLCYMDNDFNIRVFEKFPYFNNYDIQLSKDGNLFVLGSSGIFVVNANSLILQNKEVQYDLLDIKSGLDSQITPNAWNYCDGNENLYISCGTGVYKLNLKNYSFADYSYRILISSIILDSVPVNVDRDEVLTVNRNINRIQICPEVINFTVNDPIVGYWLEGYENTQTKIRQRNLSTIDYTNLPTGKYTFHLAVYGKDLNVIEETKYSFIKTKEFYDNAFFKAYMVCVAIIAVAWLTWLSVHINLQHRLDLKNKELKFAKEQINIGNSTILAIAKTVDAKDENTSQHSMRVSEYSAMIAKELGWSKGECENIRKAALLHDIGKIGIPDRILNKPGRLDDEEYEIMKSHVTRGAEILKDFTVIEHVSDGVLYHHEKYDGSGYCKGLKGDDIPIYGRIIGVADAFDAMTANRVYRKKLDFDYVISELKRCRGSQFDPKIADIMLHLIETKKINVEELYKDSHSNGGSK